MVFAVKTLRGDRWRLAVAIGLALASCLPVLVARYPQMSDYPAHLARYAVMLDAGRSADLARYYGFSWAWTGNLGVDLLIRPFAALFGLEGGGRVITGLIPPLTGLALIAVDYTLHRRVTVASFLAMAFVWSPMMLIGLLNFALGQALALWGFALWVWLDQRRARGVGRALLFVPIGLVVWLCHLSAWGLLGVLIFGYEWALRGVERRWWRAFVAPWPLLAPIIVMVPHPGTAGTFSYGHAPWLYKQAIWLRAMRDTSYSLDMVALGVVGLAIVGSVLFRRIDGRLGWAGGLLLVLSFAVPRRISGGDYADYRLITSGLMVCCLAIDWDRPRWVRRSLLVAAPALYVVRLIVTTLSWQADSAQTAQVLAALDPVPMGARVASAVLVPRENWRLDHFEHIGAYAVLRRHALVNANFAVPHVHMLQVKAGAPGFVDPSQRILQSGRQPVDLAHFVPARSAEWLWYVGERAPDSLPAGAVVVWRGPQSLLARLTLPQGAGNGAANQAGGGPVAGALAKPGKRD